MSVQKRAITIDSEVVAQINRMRAMCGEDIYDEYGLQEDDAVSVTVNFEGGYFAEIGLFVDDFASRPYLKAVLYDGGGVAVHSYETDSLDGVYTFRDVDEDGKPLVFEVCVKEGKEHNMSNEELSFAEEKEAWFAFFEELVYTKRSHEEIAFNECNFKTAEDVRNDNVEWYKDALEKGYTKEEIIKAVPAAAKYADIYEQQMANEERDER